MVRLQEENTQLRRQLEEEKTSLERTGSELASARRVLREMIERAERAEEKLVQWREERRGESSTNKESVRMVEDAMLSKISELETSLARERESSGACLRELELMRSEREREREERGKSW